jgi:hypothetical protein
MLMCSYLPAVTVRRESTTRTRPPRATMPSNASYVWGSLKRVLRACSGFAPMILNDFVKPFGPSVGASVG